MPRCLAWVGCISQRPCLQSQQNLSHPSVIQWQAGRFPGPLLSYGREQKTSKRGSSVLLLLLALVNAAMHQQAHLLPCCHHLQGPLLGCPHMGHLLQPGGFSPAAGTQTACSPSAQCQQAESRKPIPEFALVLFKTNFYLCCSWWQKITCVCSLPSVTFFHVQS